MEIRIPNVTLFKKQALRWANLFDVCSIYDSNNYEDSYSEFDLLLAVDFKDKLETTYQNAFQKLENFRIKNTDWIIGGLAYDLKNDIENLSSKHKDLIQFPDLFFFSPKHLLLLKGDILTINSRDAENVFKNISSINIHENPSVSPNQVKCNFNKEEYITTVNKLKSEISAGNIYETNFCIEFFSESASIDTVTIYEALTTNSPTPFSNYFKWFDKFIIGASPERFLAKRGNKLISQPIKGTAKRSTNSIEDLKSKTDLVNNPKERQENVMIVDLVRNDLTKSAQPGSVKVEELFGIYSFKQVHQMISTVVCEAKPNLTVVNILKNTFPMGSMTGAPKIKAMQLIEQHERNKRGIYSGAIGYISPDNDFDFNVVIRSILYNASSKYLSFQAGSAITYYADAEKEYEECLIKISATLKAVNGKLK